MKRYASRSEVPGGYYLSVSRWSIVPVPGDCGQLAGEVDEQYVRVPLLAVLPLAATLSLALVMFLPLVAFGALAYVLAQLTARLLRRTFVVAQALITPAWRPGEAHLLGEDGASEQRPEEKSASEAPLGELAKEVQARRGTDRGDNS